MKHWSLCLLVSCSLSLHAAAGSPPAKTRGLPPQQGYAKGREAWRAEQEAGAVAAMAPVIISDSIPLLEKPYAPLMAVVMGGCLGPFTEEQIGQIASTWQMVNAHSAMLVHNDISQGKMPFWAGPGCGVDGRGRSIGDRIKEINPGFVLSNYRNGSYVSQYCPEEAAEVESRFATAISVWNTGQMLVEPVGASDTSLLVTKAGEIPHNRPAIYPFIKSTTDGEHTLTKEEYVAWIRLDDEIVRIEDLEATDQGIRIQVRRGIWGTQAVSHEQGAQVFQPVYIGRNRGIDRGDEALSGRPNAGAPQPGLRYALMTFDPRFHAWLAEKAKVIFDANYDVCWLDVSVSTWYNNANAYGDDAHPWNVRNNALLTQDDYRLWQQEKNDALYRIFPDKKFFINNVKGEVYFQNGADRLQLSGENGYHPVHGGSMEMYANTRSEESWRRVVAMTLDFVNSRFWGVCWSKGADDNRYRKFSYATYLLSYDPKERLYFAFASGGNLLNKPQKLFYLDLGEPVQFYRHVDEAKLSGLGSVYFRDFSKGRILINPTPRQSASIVLAREYYDLDTGEPVSQLRLAPNTARFLLVMDE